MAYYYPEPSHTFSEYLLIPGYTSEDCVPDHVSLKTPLVKYRKGAEEPAISLNVPLTSAVMQSVSNDTLAIALAKEGGISFIYGSQSIENQAAMVARVKGYKAGFVTSASNLTPEATLADVLALKQRNGFSTVAITEDGTANGKLLGIVTSRDYRVSRMDPTDRVKNFMTPRQKLVTAPAETTLKEANDIIWEHKLNSLPIVNDEGRLCAFVFRKDYDLHKQKPNELLDSQKRYLVGAGINTRDYAERVPALVEAGVDVLVIDSSEGYSEWQKRTLAWIRERYGDIHRELGLRVDLEGVLDRLRSQMEQGISRDELVSRGEYLSALLMADYLGFTFVDAAQWLFFHYDGTIDQEKSYAALRALARDKCVVIPGFYGLMPDGKLRTLTRGGSDITGALAAAALDADVYENWTDVSGILMADPRIVDHPRSIERATYSELRQLSYSGAQVLHEMTIFPVREKNIPLNIRNTNEPDHPGTLITESFVEAPNPERFVTGIAGKCDFSIVTVSKKGLSGAVGTLRAILEVFENNSIPVAHTPSGIDCISLAMPTEALTPNQYSLLDELRSEIRPDSIQINDHIAVIAVVGRKMAFRVGTSGKIFAALGKAGINIRMISQGPDEQAIILGVDNKDYADAIRVLYNAFVK